jgi:hypothetical protein
MYEEKVVQAQLEFLPVTAFFGFHWSLRVKVLTTLQYQIKPILSPPSPLF